MATTGQHTITGVEDIHDEENKHTPLSAEMFSEPSLLDSSTTTFLVGTYTHNEILAHIPKGDHGEGIYAWTLDSTGKLSKEPTAVSRVQPNPAFILKHPTKDIIYASTECINTCGEVITLEIAHDGSLRELTRQSAGGRSTCYLTLCPEKQGGDGGARESITTLGCVNYWDAIVSLLPVDPATGVVSGPVIDQHMQPGANYVFKNNPDRVEHWTHRQRWPHTHCFVTEPYERTHHFVPDLGQDIIWCYKIEASKKLVLVGGAQLEKGQGPRHIVFHPTVKTLYVINELKSTVSVLHFHPELLHGSGTGVSVRSATDTSPKTGAFLQHVETLRTLPEDFMCTDHHKSHASEIRLHPSQKFVLIANRGHDSIAVYAIDATPKGRGSLRLANITPSGGRFPRNFNFDSSGRFVVIGNQNSNNLTVMSFCLESGAMKIVDQKYQPSPNFIYSVPGPAASAAAVQIEPAQVLPQVFKAEMAREGGDKIIEMPEDNSSSSVKGHGLSIASAWMHYIFVFGVVGIWLFVALFIGNRADL